MAGGVGGNGGLPLIAGEKADAALTRELRWGGPGGRGEGKCHEHQKDEFGVECAHYILGLRSGLGAETGTLH